MVVAEERVATALEHLIQNSRNLVADAAMRSEVAESRKAKAVRLLMEMGVGNITEVARAVGVTPKTLYRWTETRTVMEKLRAVEAWEARSPRAVRRDEL